MTNKIRASVQAALENIAEIVHEVTKRIVHEVKEARKAPYSAQYREWVEYAGKLSLLLHKFFRGDKTIEEIHEELPEKYDDDPAVIERFVQRYLEDRTRLQQLANTGISAT